MAKIMLVSKLCCGEDDECGEVEINALESHPSTGTIALPEALSDSSDRCHSSKLC